MITNHELDFSIQKLKRRANIRDRLNVKLSRTRFDVFQSKNRSFIDLTLPSFSARRQDFVPRFIGSSINNCCFVIFSCMSSIFFHLLFRPLFDFCGYSSPAMLMGSFQLYKFIGKEI